MRACSSVWLITLGAWLSLAGCDQAKMPNVTASAAVANGGICGEALFCDGFEDDVVGRLPGVPWSEEMYSSGASILISDERAFSGKKAMHVLAPKHAPRRGYVAIHDAPVFPKAARRMYGRVMVWLDAAPIPLEGAPSVHWTLLQGEGRSADDRYNSIYRLGGEGQQGLGLKANFETTPPVRTNCRRHSNWALPVARWTCVEWHFDGERNEMQYWLDGEELTDIHVIERGDAPDSHCEHLSDLNGQWLAPPAFQSVYMGWERYDASANDQNVWLDEVVISQQRVGCPNR